MSVDGLSLTVIVSLVSLIVGFVLGLRPLQAIQNGGEMRLLRALKARCSTPDYHLLNHITLRFEGSTTQVDHVLVSRFGVFVIETKDHGGWIFGDPNDRYWTQVFFRAKFRFQNPIRQNFRHVLAVRELLDFLPPDSIFSVVVFTGNAEFQTPIPDGVFHLADFIRYLENQTTEVMSINRMQFCVGRLETARLAITNKTDIEHVQRLRQRYGNRE
jgi:hypothetical protein